MADAPRNGWPSENDELAAEAGFGSWAEWVEHLEVTTKAGKPRAKRRKICGRRVRGTTDRSEADTPCCLIAGAPAATSTKGKKATPTGHLGFGACGSHGGGSLAGSAVPGYVDGKHSRYRIAGRLGEKFASVEASLSLEDDIRLQEAQKRLALDELPEDCPTPRQLLGTINRLGKAVDKTLKEGDPREMLTVAGTLRAELADVTLYWKLLDTASAAQERKRRLVDTELKRIQREHGPVSWVDVMVIVDELKGLVLDIVDTYVPKDQRSIAIKAVSNFGTGPMDRMN